MRWYTKAGIGAVLLAGAAITWMIWSSLLFEKMAGVTVDHPWMAWYTYATRGAGDFWTRLYLWVSAGIPALVIVLLAWAAIVIPMRWRTRRQPPIYGESKLAGPRDMQAGGIGRTKRFF